MKGYGDCVRGDELICDDDLCHGVDQTVCGLAYGIDFNSQQGDDDDDDDERPAETVPVRNGLL